MVGQMPYPVADPEGGTGGTCSPYFLIHYLIAIYNLDSKLVANPGPTI